MKNRLLLVLVGAMLCALPFMFKTKKINSAHASTIVQEEVYKEDKNWTKEDVKEVLTYVAVGAGGVATALSFSIPIYLKIKKAKDAIVSTNKQICAKDKENKESEDNIKMSESYLRKQDREYQKALQHNTELIEDMRKELSMVKEICKLGFVNNRELVSKGIATAISKVGQDEEHKE
jgi:hypothetical protein